METEAFTPTSGLDKAEVLGFWERTNPQLLILLREMERRESWVVIGEESKQIVAGVESVLPEFCQQYFVDNLNLPEKASLLATLVGHIGATQFVAFLMQAEGIREGIVKQITFAMRGESQGEDAVFVDLFMERLQLVLQSELKRYVFSASRIAEVAAIVKSVKKMRAQDAAS